MPIDDAIATIAERYQGSAMPVNERAQAAAADLIVASGFDVTSRQVSRTEMYLVHGITTERLMQAYTALGGVLDVSDNRYQYVVRMGWPAYAVQGLTIERLRQIVAELGDA